MIQYNTLNMKFSNARLSKIKSKINIVLSNFKSFIKCDY